MAEQEGGVEGAVLDPEIERQAREIGWKPESEWKGEPPRGGFVSAEEYLRRGEEVVPFIRAENRRLKEQLQQMQGEGRTSAEQIRMLNASVQSLKQAMDEGAAANDVARRAELVEELKDAIKEDDADRQAEILEQLNKPPEVKKTSAAPVQQPGVDQRLNSEIAGFMAENASWYGPDEDRTVLMDGICARMRQQGDTRVGREFLEAAKAKVEEKLNGARSSKVGSSSRTTAGSTGTAGGGRYSDLPADARAQCDKDAPSKFPSRRYKDIGEYRRSWAELYFSQG